MLSNKIMGTAKAVEPAYIEDVFSTYLYTGNGTSQTINNGIDLAGKGGLVWLKARSEAANHGLVDTARGFRSYLSSDSTAAAYTNVSGYDITAFNANGFALGPSQAVSTNTSGQTYASWTFRKQPKFFDVVTYTGDGTGLRQIPHSLASVPGCIIVKDLNTSDKNWNVWHTSLNSEYESKSVYLNLTSAAGASNRFGNLVLPSATTFNINGALNESGTTYVAYLFAHNAGGFGLSGTENAISCGSFTTTTGGNATVDLGYEPQWVLMKAANNSASNWELYDVMRGSSNSGTSYLSANTSGAEASTTAYRPMIPTATGFTTSGWWGSGLNMVYIAIRRGPMRTPITGTSVFAPAVGDSSGNTTPPEFFSGFPVDGAFLRSYRSTTGGTTELYSRLTGSKLTTSTTGAEATGYSYELAYNTGFFANGRDSDSNAWMLRRAPGFMDTVCYTGEGSAMTVAHNLTVVPQLMIVKQRNTGNSWYVYAEPLGASSGIALNGNFAAFATTGQFSLWNDTSPTASVFSLGQSSSVSTSGGTYIAYLFATCAGVSKVGSYTGTGTTQVIDCGFTTGARFVLIKRTSSAGDWYVWDSARGLTPNNDPFLYLNNDSAETTGTNYVNPVSSGFELTASAGQQINGSGSSFIFLAIS